MIDENILEQKARFRVFLSWGKWCAAIFLTFAGGYCAVTGLAHAIGWCMGDFSCTGPFYAAKHILPAFGILFIPGIISAIVIINVLEPRLKKDVEAAKATIVENHKARELKQSSDKE